MKQWWAGLQASERRILILGGIVLGLILPYFMVWQPMQENVAVLQKQVQEQRAVKRWMSQSAAEVKQLSRGSGNAVRPRDGRSLLAVVDQTAKRSGLGAGLKRLEPDGQVAVKVWLEQVSFDDMLRWLTRLEQKNGLAVATITIDRQDVAGRVNARMTLEMPEV
ncbi:MAG TPA: type II secretion system protein M [Candidatus Tenderia electrophaga]|uniref:Type II secretion system protein M n=1 Tax=Candidatus Tenderia electrophaga TaxID=1748243 RepID=A0A832N3U1_9GAMM|nr:type II secretion system protein M [Candidatus Tenderia electrophaga]